VSRYTNSTRKTYKIHRVISTCSFFIRVLSNQATVSYRKQSSGVKLSVSRSELTRKAISITRGWVSVNFVVSTRDSAQKCNRIPVVLPSGLRLRDQKLQQALDGDRNFICTCEKLPLPTIVKSKICASRELCTSRWNPRLRYSFIYFYINRIAIKLY